MPHRVRRIVPQTGGSPNTLPAVPRGENRQMLPRAGRKTVDAKGTLRTSSDRNCMFARAAELQRLILTIISLKAVARHTSYQTLSPHKEFCVEECRNRCRCSDSITVYFGTIESIIIRMAKFSMINTTITPVLVRTTSARVSKKYARCQRNCPHDL